MFFSAGNDVASPRPAMRSPRSGSMMLPAAKYGTKNALCNGDNRYGSKYRRDEAVLPVEEGEEEENCPFVVVELE